MANGPTRFFGLDIHKEYFVGVGVNVQREVIFGPQRVSNYQLAEWAERVLTLEDAVALEMSTNTYLFYDTLVPHVRSVIAVHPPSVALVTNAQVKTDKKAALALAQLHAAGMLTGVWIPPHEGRDLRALIARRDKMVRLSTMAKTGCIRHCSATTWSCQRSHFLRSSAVGGRIFRSQQPRNFWCFLIWIHSNLLRNRLSRLKNALSRKVPRMSAFRC